MEIREKARLLKAELDSLRPLEAEAEQRIMQKFRLEWNYHSNNLEGNSLTYGETKALLLFGITAQGKPLKDHFEITGHNEAINWVLDLVRGDAELSEVFIRELHTLLLKEVSYKEALTNEGKPTRRKIEVGKYKTQPNHVVTATGETFYFASPEETPARMQELIEWYRQEMKKPDVDHIALAALFHYRFVRIHPFDDGNGRVARILMNFILLKLGYPPVIIRTEDKENYYSVLRLADAGEPGPFINYIAENLSHSLDIMIRGARGENIDDPDDLEKELALLDRRYEALGDKTDAKMTREILDHFIENSFRPLVNSLAGYAEQFSRFYTRTSIVVTSEPGIYVAGALGPQRSFKLEPGDVEAQLGELVDMIFSEPFSPDETLAIKELALKCVFDTFNRVRSARRSYFSQLVMIFREGDFSIVNSEGRQVLKQRYCGYLSDDKIGTIVSDLSSSHLALLKNGIDDANGEPALG